MKKWIKKSFHRQLLFCFAVVALFPLLLFGVSLIQTMETKINSDYEKRAFRNLGDSYVPALGAVFAASKKMTHLCYVYFKVILNLFHWLRKFALTHSKFLIFNKIF